MTKKKQSKRTAKQGAKKSSPRSGVAPTLHEIPAVAPVQPQAASPPAFIKRVIGLPGDVIKIENGVGVRVNGKLFVVPNATVPDYDLSTLGDIQGASMQGKWIRPYGDSTGEIVVPANSYFMMGDNRNASADSHVWGFVSKDRVVGRACLVFWKQEWLQSLLSKRG